MGEAKRNKEEREERFKTHPEEYFHQDEIVLAVVKTEHGMATLHGACTRADFEMALSRINYKTFMNFQVMDMMAAKKAAQREAGIITT